LPWRVRVRERRWGIHKATLWESSLSHLTPFSTTTIIIIAIIIIITTIIISSSSVSSSRVRKGLSLPFVPTATATAATAAVSYRH
jgi:hypothetical protein